MLVPTCYCLKCEMFVGVDGKGQCDNCWEQICFLQDIDNHFKIFTGELQK